MSQELVTLTIDGVSVSVPKGMPIIEAAKQAGVLIRHYCADAYRVNNEYEKASADYSRAIELIPRESRLYFGRGKSYLALNETEKAIADFSQAAVMADKLHLKHQAEELLNKVTITLEVTATYCI